MSESKRYPEESSGMGSLRGDPDVFGDPDGARADLSGFIDVSQLSQSTFYNPNSTRVRVVIGRKGSGKTLYLRRLGSLIRSNDSVNLLDGDPKKSPVVSEAEQTQLLSTRHVLEVAHKHPENYLTEIWQLYWGRAIILAAATHLAFDSDLTPYVSPEDRARLHSDFKRVLGGAREARSPFTAIKQLIADNGNRKSSEFVVMDPLWDDLETRVGLLLRNSPPLYFIIDAIDEEFGRAPAYWMRCQKGLFYETMRLLRNSRLGGRLHVLISIRDIVFTSIFRSEHASRYIGDPHISILDWGYDSAAAFLEAKIARLGAGFAPEGKVPESLTDWIGMKTVRNSLGVTESVYSYAMRHTQLLPRDIVQFGNLLGASLQRHKNAGAKFDEEGFREVVSRIAFLSGRQQVTVAANQVVSDEIPPEASRFDFVDSYLSVSEYREDRADQIISLIAACETLRITHETLLELQAAGRREFGAPDIATVLWQSGLLGIQPKDGAPAEFFSYDRMGRMRLPARELQYVFHPSMREVAGLSPSGDSVLWRA